MALLDDPDRQTRVVEGADPFDHASLSVGVEGVGRGETLAELAAELGTTRQTISRYMAKHPGFKRRVDTARSRAAKLAHERDCLPDRAAVDAEIIDDLNMLGLPSPAALGRLLWETARNPNAKGQGRAQAILAELVYRPIVRAAEAEPDANQPRSGVVMIEMPRNGSEAPGRGPQPSSSIVVEPKINGTPVAPSTSQ